MQGKTGEPSARCGKIDLTTQGSGVRKSVTFLGAISKSATANGRELGPQNLTRPAMDSHDAEGRFSGSGAFRLPGDMNS